jgi:hypothetical protein
MRTELEEERVKGKIAGKWKRKRKMTVGGSRSRNVEDDERWNEIEGEKEGGEKERDDDG